MFSNSTQYAIRTVLFLSRNQTENYKLKVENIAFELDIPKAFLSKILQQLSRSNIVSSSKGRGGGFYLSNENMERPLMDIILCMEGHDVFNKCILGLSHCGDDNPCYLHEYYAKLRIDLQKVIKDVSIKNLHKSDIMNKFKL